MSKWAGGRWVDILDRQAVSWRARLQSSEWENIGPINILRQANRLELSGQPGWWASGQAADGWIDR